MTPQKVTSKQNVNNSTTNLSQQGIRNKSILEWQQKIDNNTSSGMTVSMSSSIDAAKTSFKAGVFPLFDPETFTKDISRRGGRNKTGHRHSATARFIKGDRKVLSK